MPTVQDEPESRPGGIPLYVWVVAAVLVAIPVGRALGRRRDEPGAACRRVILRALTALAAPLVVLAILSAIVTNEIRGRLGALMMVFYLVNTLVAMLIGLTSDEPDPAGNRCIAQRAGRAAAQPRSRNR